MVIAPFDKDPTDLGKSDKSQKLSYVKYSETLKKWN